MPERLAKAHHIPVNDAVVRLPTRKTLTFWFCDMEEHIGEPGSAFQLLWDTLNSLSLSPNGPIIKEMFIMTHAGPHQHTTGRFLVPLE